MNIESLNRDDAISAIFETMEKFPVLAGRVTREQASHIVTELVMKAAEKRDPIVLEVGGTYRNGFGDEISIVKETPHSVLPDVTVYVGSDEWGYAVNGRWSWDEDVVCKSDLIEVVYAPSDSCRLADITKLVDRLRVSADESESGRNMAGTPQYCRQAADLLSKYGSIITSLQTRHDEIIRIMGRMSARSMGIDAVKLYRALYGTSLLETVEIVNKAEIEEEKRDAYINPLSARVVELEECLRQTRELVSSCAASSFAEPEFISRLYRNNGKITQLVPQRPEDRVLGTQKFRMIDDALNPNNHPISNTSISLEVGKSYRTGEGSKVIICERKDDPVRYYDTDMCGYFTDGCRMFHTDPLKNIISVIPG
jgi:hypothetical protein